MKMCWGNRIQDPMKEYFWDIHLRVKHTDDSTKDWED